MWFCGTLLQPPGLETELNQEEDLYDTWLGTQLLILDPGYSDQLILSTEWHPSFPHLCPGAGVWPDQSQLEGGFFICLPAPLGALPRPPPPFLSADLLVLVNSPKISGFWSHLYIPCLSELLPQPLHQFFYLSLIWQLMLHSALRVYLSKVQFWWQRFPK